MRTRTRTNTITHQVQAWASASGGCFVARNDPAVADECTTAAEANLMPCAPAAASSLRASRSSSARSVRSGWNEVNMCNNAVNIGDCPKVAEADMARSQAAPLPAGFVRWRDVQEAELGAGGRVRWGKVKSVQRAIEKATRSYRKV